MFTSAIHIDHLSNGRARAVVDRARLNIQVSRGSHRPAVYGYIYVSAPRVSKTSMRGRSEKYNLSIPTAASIPIYVFQILCFVEHGAPALALSVVAGTSARGHLHDPPLAYILGLHARLGAPYVLRVRYVQH